VAGIEYTDLTRTYGERRVLDGVTGRIEAGEFVVVLGRSGSGKSTLLNLLGGLERPDAGAVRLDGESIFTLNDRRLTLLRRHRIGVVFQGYNLVPTLTVAENLALPLELTGQPVGNHIDQWLERVGLAGFASRMPDQLSGGEAQRVAIARALIHGPQLILADEPTGNLDLDNAEQVVGLLESLCRAEGRTLVMVTHSREVVGRVDRVCSIRDGQLVAAGA